MAVQKIALDIDGMLHSIDKIVARLQDFPSEGALQESRGAYTGVAREFRSELAQTARQLELVASRVRENLGRAQEAIRATMNTMVERDAAVADEARALLALVGDIALEPSTGSVAPEKPTTTGTFR
jgi:hypothetical protein